LIALYYIPELDRPINLIFLRLVRGSNPGKAPSQIAAKAWSAYKVLFEAVQRLQRRGGF